MNRTLVIVATLAALAAAARGVDAQPATAQAEQLFRDGKRLMKEGNIAEACEAFEGGYRLAPTVSTLLNLADCREKNQQYASAWAHFLEAGRQARTDATLTALATVAQRRAESIEKRLSFLVINIPDEARVEGLKVTRNGEPVDPAVWNRDVPIDGGPYRIEATAPGYETWSATVTVDNAKDKESVTVPRFGTALTATNDRPPQAGIEGAPSSTGKRGLAIGLWATGAVALGGGLAFMLAADSTYGDAKASTDDARRHALVDDATRQRRNAVAATTFGAVAVAAGVVLWVRSRPRDRSVAVTPHLAGEHVGVVLTGRF